MNVAPADVIDRWFAAQPDLPTERLDGGWLTVLSGERKRTIPVFLSLGEHTLSIQSFFMRAPDENEAEVYRYLLARNMRTYLLRFAIDETGDILLVGVLPTDMLTIEELDRVLGQVLSIADGGFDSALRTGFESYIEREQAWRERVGLPRNPIS